MFYRPLPSCLFIVLALLLTAGIRPALAAPLMVVAGAGTTVADQDRPPAGRYDFGTRLLSDDTAIVHTFTLRNAGTAPVTLSRLEAACGCTTAVLSGTQTLPLTLGVGQTVSVEVNVSPSRLIPGPAEKIVRVYTTDDSMQEAAVLEIFGTVQTGSESPAPTNAVSEAAPAPSFTLTDTNGKAFTLSAERGHPVALFFFCGCPWCADVAQSWGEAQRRSLLPARAQTVIVFAGDKAAASAFALKNKLDLKQTRLLPDPDTKLTDGVYHVADCPRAFVVDPAGLVRYTNIHTDDRPRLAPAKTIVAHILKALGQTGQVSRR